MAPKTILLVDDDVDFIVVNKLALEAAGYVVLVAYDSHEALAHLDATPIDGAVLDVVMTRPDEGFHLARAIRKHPRACRIPLIMLTSVNAVHEAQGHPLRLNDNDRDPTWLPVDKFLDKPVKPDKLAAIVGEIVG